MHSFKRRELLLALGGILLIFSSGCRVRSNAPNSGQNAPTNEGQGVLPRPDHIVIVVDENHSFKGILGSRHDPYLNNLANESAVFTASYGVAHPSQPNYLALFSGSTQGVHSDSCPHTFSGANLASELISHGLSFAGYAESMPEAGFKGCHDGYYWRKHNPWVNFTNVPAACNLLWTSFPTDYTKLPAVSFVVPNIDNDMHNRSSKYGDAWLQWHLDSYVKWAKEHNSLLIITWDEDDYRHRNRIPTLFCGPMVKPGRYSTRINHYDVLRTVEDMYSLSHLGHSAQATPITGVWTKQ